jgi:hypothetical protein
MQNRTLLPIMMTPHLSSVCERTLHLRDKGFPRITHACMFRIQPTGILGTLSGALSWLSPWRPKQQSRTEDLGSDEEEEQRDEMDKDQTVEAHTDR